MLLLFHIWRTSKRHIFIPFLLPPPSSCFYHFWDGFVLLHLNEAAWSWLSYLWNVFVKSLTASSWQCYESIEAVLIAPFLISFDLIGYFWNWMMGIGGLAATRSIWKGGKVKVILHLSAAVVTNWNWSRLASISPWLNCDSIIVQSADGSTHSSTQWVIYVFIFILNMWICDRWWVIPIIPARLIECFWPIDGGCDACVGRRRRCQQRENRSQPSPRYLNRCDVATQSNYHL